MKDEKARQPEDLKTRTKRFALRVVRLYTALPRTVAAQVMGKQMLRAGTSVGAHYREAIRSRSTAEFVGKIEGALQEIEEAAYWMELIVESEIMDAKRIRELQSEANELTAVLTACAMNAKRKGSRK